MRSDQIYGVTDQITQIINLIYIRSSKKILDGDEDEINYLQHFGSAPHRWRLCWRWTGASALCRPHFRTYFSVRTTDRLRRPLRRCPAHQQQQVVVSGVEMGGRRCSGWSRPPSFSPASSSTGHPPSTTAASVTLSSTRTTGTSTTPSSTQWCV